MDSTKNSTGRSGKKLTRIFTKGILIIILFLATVLLIFTCNQEKIFFIPDTLPKDYRYTFKNKFEELTFQVDNKIWLNGVLFHTDSCKGLIFYLHGNGGSAESWGHIADNYLGNRYDIFILDYRGYGKSQGKITGEKQLYSDDQIVYDSLKTMYEERNIIIIGYSIGTGLAAKLASTNNPKMLILTAPYYNMPDLAHHIIKFVPPFLIWYKFKTNEFLPLVKCPLIIFHGDRDEVIYTGSSYKLKELFKPGDSLIILEGQKHNGINENVKYREELKEILK
jgi:uncharacterized protein